MRRNGERVRKDAKVRRGRHGRSERRFTTKKRQGTARTEMRQNGKRMEPRPVRSYLPFFPPFTVFTAAGLALAAGLDLTGGLAVA